MISSGNDSGDTSSSGSDSGDTGSSGSDSTLKPVNVINILPVEDESSSPSEQSISFPIATNAVRDEEGNFKLEIGSENAVLVYLGGGAEFNIETDLIIETLVA